MARGEARARHVLHDDARPSARFDDVVDGGDAAMIQLRGRTRFTDAADSFGGIRRLEDLDRDIALQPRIARAVHLAAAAASERLDQDVGTRFEAWSELEVGRSNRRGRSARSEFLIDEALRSLRLLFVARRSCVDERARLVGLQHRLDFASQLGVVARRFEERAAIGRGP